MSDIEDWEHPSGKFPIQEFISNLPDNVLRKKLLPIFDLIKKRGFDSFRNTDYYGHIVSSIPIHEIRFQLGTIYRILFLVLKEGKKIILLDGMIKNDKKHQSKFIDLIVGRLINQGRYRLEDLI